MTEFEFNELFYRAFAMSDLLTGLIVGMCLVGLPVVIFWPRKSKAATATATESVSQTAAADAPSVRANEVSDSRESEMPARFLPGVSQSSV